MESTIKELGTQPEVLSAWSSHGLPKASPGSIFVGAGDSYAAAVAGFHLSSAKCLALDPYVLTASPKIATGRDVYLISASGRTRSNVNAARRVRRLARETIAITGDETSELARMTDKKIILPYEPSPRTPGMLSFSLSLLTVMRIVHGRISCDFDRVFARARRDAKVMLFARGTTYFLGNGPAYSAALYASAKVYELLGAAAHAEYLEEFSHMELFSLQKTDTANIFSGTDPLRVAPKLNRSLLEKGFTSSLIPSFGRNPSETMFYWVFLAQHAVLAQAKLANLTAPSFLGSEDKLGVSDDLIY